MKIERRSHSKKDTLVNRTFEKKYYCAHCGEIYIHTRNVKDGKESHTWSCKRFTQANHFEKCVSQRFKQKYLEKNFMYFLLDVKTEAGFSDKVNNCLKALRLTDEEIREECNIRNEIKELNEELYDAVNTELNRKGQDSRKVDELTERIVTLQEALREFTTRRRKVIKVEEEHRWLINELKTLDVDLITSNNGLGYDELLYFREDIFARIIEKATMDKSGKISYFLTLGICCDVDYVYKEYNNEVKEYRVQMREKKHEEFLRSDEIRELIEFCSEPKDLYEMLDFMNSKIKISFDILKRKVVSDLLERGRLINVTPKSGVKNNRKYYQKPITKDE